MNKKLFKHLHGEKIIKNGYTLKIRNQANESQMVKKAKLLLLKNYQHTLFLEVSARKGVSPGAMCIDAYDIENRIGIETHWQHKKIHHDSFIERIKKYQKIFGKISVLFLQWGEGNGFKPTRGYTHIQKHNLKKYKENNIDVVFFNTDKPNFDWLR